MKEREQSTIEFLILISGIILIAILIGLFLYSGSSKINESLINLTRSQFEIFNFNLYISSNTIYGTYYQNGNLTYSKATIYIEIDNQSYTIPVSTTYHNSTTGYMLFNFNSSTIPASLSSNMTGGTPFIFEFIKFNSGGKNYIFVANQQEIVKQN